MGVSKVIVVPGDGATFPAQGQELTVHYTGKLDDGSLFDSSVAKGAPLTFQVGVGAVIRGARKLIQGA